MRILLGLDVGGTNVKAVLATAAGRPLRRARWRTAALGDDPAAALNGLAARVDALLSTVQMPPGIPVATVALGRGGAKNAAVLAAQILALKHTSIAAKLKAYREGLTQEAIEKGKKWEKK